MGKALLIKSSAGDKESIQGTWHLFEQATPYIQGIETGDLAEKVDADTLNFMISGLPNIWSRAIVFGYAFKYTQKDANISTSGLIKFYEAIVRGEQKFSPSVPESFNVLMRELQGLCLDLKAEKNNKQ